MLRGFCTEPGSVESQKGNDDEEHTGTVLCQEVTWRCLNAGDNTRLQGSAHKKRPERLPAELESKESKTKKVLKQSFLLTTLIL